MDVTIADNSKLACTNLECTAYGKRVLPSGAKLCPKCGSIIEIGNIGNPKANELKCPECGSSKVIGESQTDGTGYVEFTCCECFNIWVIGPVCIYCKSKDVDSFKLSSSDYYMCQCKQCGKRWDIDASENELRNLIAMRCMHCNGEHPDDYKFCPVTGKAIELPMKACSNPDCDNFEKHVLPAEARFCPKCGQMIAGDDLSKESGGIVFSVNGVQFEMVCVSGGSFYMGSDDEGPIHRVTLSTYHIGKYPVTQELWEAVMGYNPSCFKGTNKPVDSVSWYDCQKFIRKLNRLTGKKFKLPTEAQWEFAARGGNDSAGYKYSGSDDIDAVAWFDSDETQGVGELLPNELGIYDMSGNVSEWCSDWFRCYNSSAETDPMGPPVGDNLVVRGGGIDWSPRDCADNCAVYSRRCLSPHQKICTQGFRLCL